MMMVLFLPIGIKKPTFSGRILHFLSKHPIHQKSSMVYGLVDKAIKLSHDKHHNDNLNLVRNILYANSYPKDFCEKYISKRLAQIKKPTLNSQNNNQSTPPPIYISLPFQKPLINKIDKICKNNNIRIAYKAKNKLTSIIKKGKDTLDRNLQTNVIYNIHCKQCDSKYIGTTKRKLSTHITEHDKNINRLPKYHFVLTHH